MAQKKTAISPTREEDFAEWYQQVVRAAELAENSEVRGCMVIKPWGYGLWEQMQRQLDAMFKATGHKNAYFPLFIPLSYLQREAEHVEGFAKECAVVTHHRLEAGPDGELRPAGELTEPLVVRPTSETIIGATYAKWIQSYRDLPVLINQWANVVRWEMRPRLFLRTAEFLWQEGHTAHETAEEAHEETMRMLRIYEKFAREHLAMPVIAGEKSESERFPGAVNTFTIEAMVQDRRAIQAGTSHFLGQNFARAAGIKFASRSGAEEFAWTTSWGVSTRLIGALVMTHGDDDGAILPPRVAPSQAVILPVTPKEDSRPAVMRAVEELKQKLDEQKCWGEPLRVEIDDRDIGGGTKNWEWIKRGVPARIELGPRDLEKGTVALARRDRGAGDKEFLDLDEAVARLPHILEEIQAELLQRATAWRDDHMPEITERQALYDFFTPENPEKPEVHGGFVKTWWDGTTATEEKLKNDLKITIRCIPLDQEAGEGVDPISGQKTGRRVLYAKAY